MGLDRADAIRRLSAWTRPRLPALQTVDVTVQLIRWNPDPWRASAADWHPNARGAVESLADRSSVMGRWRWLTRQTVFDTDPEDSLAVFVAAMVFGFGDRGYGPTRTTLMLGTDGARAKIAHAHELLREPDGVDLAHRHLINRAGRLRWCRTAFVSKFLYFAGFGDSPGTKPLIFDGRVQSNLRTRCEVKLRLSFTDDYVAYCDLLTAVAEQHQLRPDVLELALFADE